MILNPNIQSFIIEHENDNIHALALQGKKYPDIDMPFAIQQIAGRQIAKIKIPTWYNNPNILYPKHISLEQCSSEHTARYKANLCKGNSMVDLTGGFGVDFSFIAQQFEEATYVEQQQELTELAQNNFKALGLDTKIVNADSIEHLKTMQKVDTIYLDPARRSTSGRKTVLIEDCTPNIIEIEDLLEKKSEQTIIKLSPMLDISLAVKSMRYIAEVHIISHMNECKELLFIKKKGCNQAITLHCMNILNNNNIDSYTFTKEDEEQTFISYTNQIGQYLYEPNASIIKGGAYKSITKTFDINKLHVNSHLYTSDTLHENFFGRKFLVKGVCTLNKKEVKSYLKDISQANISVRNFPLTPLELKKRLDIKDGGDNYIFATTLSDNKKVLVICHKL